MVNQNFKGGKNIFLLLIRNQKPMITFSSHSPITIAISFLGFSRCSLICTFFVITLSYCPVDYMWERFPKNILHCIFHCENVLLFLVSDAAQCKYCQEIFPPPHAKLIHNTVIIIPFIAYIKFQNRAAVAAVT